LKIPGGNLASEAAAQVRSQVTERTKIVIENRPAAALFATMGEDEFQALVADIGKNGQREPIVVHEGEVLDGRHRLKACQELGIEPIVKGWAGECGTPEAFVATKNLLRRHLTESQRAILTAELAMLPRPGTLSVNGEEKTENPGLTDTQAAKADAGQHTHGSST
jgi:hypothetical protein